MPADVLRINRDGSLELLKDGEVVAAVTANELRLVQNGAVLTISKDGVARIMAPKGAAIVDLK